MEWKAGLCCLAPRRCGTVQTTDGSEKDICGDTFMDRNWGWEQPSDTFHLPRMFLNRSYRDNWRCDEVFPLVYDQVKCDSASSMCCLGGLMPTCLLAVPHHNDNIMTCIPLLSWLQGHKNRLSSSVDRRTILKWLRLNADSHTSSFLKTSLFFQIVVTDPHNSK